MSHSLDNGAKPTTDLTRSLNAAVEIPSAATDPESKLATAGLVEALPPDYRVPPDARFPAWDLGRYSTFLSQEALNSPPDTVNPSLWRNAVLNMNAGLYEVVPDAVYRRRPGPLPCGAVRCEDRAIAAVIFTHSHVDHYGGVRGLFDGRQPGADVQIIAPEGFLEHAVSENVYAGNAMTRRATFMYGVVIPKSPMGQVDAGLGKEMSTGTTGLLAPTTVITALDEGHPVPVGPIDIVFQLTPDTEAPAELNFHLP